MVRGVLSEASL